MEKEPFGREGRPVTLAARDARRGDPQDYSLNVLVS